MNSPLTIAGLTVAALALTASTAAAQMQWTNLGFVNVSRLKLNQRQPPAAIRRSRRYTP